MTLIKWGVCLVAALQASFAWTQGSAPSQAGAAPKAAETGVKPAAATSPDVPDTAYRSTFTDYRRFKPEEPLKTWRRANDEVRDAGGHVGLMKGAQGASMGHGGHRAKPKEVGK